MKQLIGLLTLASSLSTFAAPLPLGQNLEGLVSFCTTEAEAKAVVQAHQANGLAVASRMVQQSPTCDTATVGFKIVREVTMISHGDKKVYVLEIQIEMADDSWKLFYGMFIFPRGVEA